jgi:hypothetical protein
MGSPHTLRKASPATEINLFQKQQCMLKQPVILLDFLNMGKDEESSMKEGVNS